ncbi:CPXCG motif-containing cysteine-rich protein [Kushneria aurantia]|uniref:CPXCG motif-containing cysteine-rich protein n=1 Tax=Kushneria aurantia TaxID=504092 RepID=A0ABV6G769_9GAMM|nr:CPXCG motif-containing cysteine-rich protein [Kushneria aurantia]
MCDQWLSWQQEGCPHCGAANDIPVDISQGSHETWVDCHWCCAPIMVAITVSPLDDTLESVVLKRDDEV